MDSSLIGRQVEGLIAIQQILEKPIRLVAKPEVQRQSGKNAPGIAEIPSGLGAAPLLVFAAVLGEKGEGAQHEVGAVEALIVAERGDMAVELELARTVKARI